jgi:hypothetical protein
MNASTTKVVETKTKPAAVKKNVVKHMSEERYHIVETAANNFAECHGSQGCTTAH